ncbi:hypothetical protein AE925_11685 [Xanthomonas arboricola]|uniref:hypothetical protein n=1 Tax=Xanthomonas arboricola TaxID=56448 RepID=UPI00069CF47C|nr:hypothetical protein [Xanthomonas arboricola]KOB18433.1 hypothetical protein AE925_11685 [Xanthomonas arboricola]
MKIFQSSLVQFLIAAGGLALLWSVTERVNANFSALPIQQLNTVTDSGAVAATTTLYPVWVGTPASALAVGQEDVDLNGAFGSETASTEGDEVVPNYAESLRPNLKVDGTANGGAFINGRYYPIGREMDALGIQREDGGRVMPKLVSVAEQRIVIAVGTETLVLEPGAPGWQ